MSDSAVSNVRTVRGVLWAGATHGLSKAAIVVSTIVLARILVPADFGLFALGLLVVNYLDRIKDVGVGASLVYRREPWTRMARTGLPLSLLSSILLAAVAFVAAPWVATFFHDPAAADLVRALSLVVLVSGLCVVPESKIRREVDFRRRLVPETSAAVVKGGLAIVLALNGYGVWSLVWSQLAGSAVAMVLYWLVAGWRPSFGFDVGDARRLLRYGVPSAMVAVFALLIENIDYLVIGHRMSTEALGYYTLAFRLPELLVIGACIVVGQVLFPVFARLQDDRRALRRSYLGALQHVVLLLTPVALLLALLAGDLVPVAYSSGWGPVVPVLQLLALFTLVYAVGFHAGEVYKALGRPGILNTIALVRLAVLVPALWFAAGHSIVAVALVMLLAQVGITLLELVIVSRFLALAPRDFASSLRPAVLAAVVMVPAVLAAGAVLGDAPPLLRLVGLSLLGVGTYAAAVRILAPQVFRGVVETVRALTGRRPAAPAPDPVPAEVNA